MIPDTLRADLIEQGLSRAIDDAKSPHSRVKSVFDTLEAQEPGLHNRLLFSGDAGQVGDLLALYRERHNEITNEENDPLRHGWMAPGGKQVLGEIDRILKADSVTVPKILCLGGNRASKTEFAAWFIMDLMIKKPGALVAVLCPSESQAIEVAMKRLWKYFPPEWKNEATGKGIKAGPEGAYTYTTKNGFTEGRFSLPNKSTCVFKFYVDGNVKNWEGGEYDAVWADEEVTQAWVDAAVYRLLSRRGVLLITFTPITGYTPVVNWFCSDTSVVKRRAAEMLDNEMLPVLEQSKDKSVVYFWTQDTQYPLNQYQILKQELVGGKKPKPKSEIKTRAYGIPVRVKDAAFPTFSNDVHCFTPSPELLLKLQTAAQRGDKPTWYHIVDPCSGRPFFMQWWMVTPGLGHFKARLMREWPQMGDDVPGWGDPGEWAVPSKDNKLKDGERGPAQEKKGYTVNFMHSEMDRVEHELAVEFEGATDLSVMIEPYKRIMDSRGGGVTQMSGESNDNLIDEFYKLRPDGSNGRDFERASGQNLNPSSHRSSDGIHMINDWLGYNTEEDVGELNCPRIQIHTRCQNTAWALKNFTGADGSEAACKDPVDCVHYFVRDDPAFVDERDFIIDTNRRL